MSHEPDIATLEAEYAAAAERVRARRHALGLAKDAALKRMNDELHDLRTDLLTAEHALEHIAERITAMTGHVVCHAEPRHSESRHG